MSEQRLPAIAVHQFCRQLFEALGFPEQDAEAAAESLVRADLEGAGSHGVSRMVIYAHRLREGRIAARPQIHIDRCGAILKVDGGNGLGQVVATHAIRSAVPVAKECGLSGIFIRNSNHFGTAAYYCEQACQAGLALIAMTNSPPGIPPWGGRKAYFGTNPIAFGFPTREAPPVIIDMSSSIAARGKIILAHKLGQPIPEGWAIDEDGVETTDAGAALKGAVLPLGGAKGYALALAVEMMAGIMTQAAFGPHVNNLYKDGDPPANVGHAFILFDPSVWMPMEEYYVTVEQFLREVKEVPLAKHSEEILIPGERRHRSYVTNLREGISLPGEVIAELKQLGEACCVPFPDLL